MSQPENPFAPPSASLEDISPDRIWRDGKVLVAPLGAVLPPRCVSCGEPAAETKKRTFYWHHPALYLFLFCGVLVYVLLAIIFRRRAQLTVGLCERHSLRRRNGILLGWGGAFAGVGLAFFGGSEQSCGLMAAGGLLFLGTIIAGLFLARVLYPDHIDRAYARMKGCGEGFLADLPDFHG